MVFSKRVALSLIAGSILLAAQEGRSENLVRVRIYSKYDLTKVKIVSEVGHNLLVNNLAYLPEITFSVAKNGLEMRHNSHVKKMSYPLSLAPEIAAFIVSGPGLPSRSFMGQLEITIVEGKLNLINTLPMESYTTAVMASEAGNLRAGQALLAQAIVCRTFASSQKGRHSETMFDFCDLTHCQVYSGFSEIPEKIYWATESSRSKILAYKGEAIHSYYHSTCGGLTENIENVWESPAIPYLRAVEDRKDKFNFCETSPHFRWTSRLTTKELQEFLVKIGGIRSNEKLLNIALHSDSVSRRAIQVSFVTTGGEFVMNGSSFHQAAGKHFGWNKIKSAVFEISKKGGEYYFEGKGLGHRVGFCQWGAEGMANKGYDHVGILKHYFAGTDVIRKP